MSLLILQTLGLWLLAGTAFWAAFVVLGFRFVEAREPWAEMQETASVAGVVRP